LALSCSCRPKFSGSPALLSCPIASACWLGSLDYLMVSGETTSDHVRRALEQSGNDIRVMAIVARAAVQTGDLELRPAAGGSRLKSTRRQPMRSPCPPRAVLSTEQILDQVVPRVDRWRSGSPTFSIPTRLESRPCSLPHRSDQTGGLIPNKLHWNNCGARAKPGPASTKWPRPARRWNPQSRKNQLARNARRICQLAHPMGDFEEAFNQATIGVALSPLHSGARTTLDRASEAEGETPGIEDPS